MTDTAAVRQIIEQHNANLVQWYAEGAVDKVAEVFTKDCWQMPPNSQPLVGREALREGWRQMVGWGKCDFSLETRDVLASGTIGGSVGPLVAGRAFDMTASYHIVFLILTLLAVTGLILVTLLPPRGSAAMR